MGVSKIFCFLVLYWHFHKGLRLRKTLFYLEIFSNSFRFVLVLILKVFYFKTKPTWSFLRSDGGKWMNTCFQISTFCQKCSKIGKIATENFSNSHVKVFVWWICFNPELQILSSNFQCKNFFQLPFFVELQTKRVPPPNPTSDWGGYSAKLSNVRDLS